MNEELVEANSYHLVGKALDYAVAKANKGVLHSGDEYIHNYSSSWSFSGPIIEREKICLEVSIANPDRWIAEQHIDDFDAEGDTPIMAALRCFVVSKLGATVQVPKHLMK